MPWPDRRVLELLRIEVPILLAPMAGPGLAALGIAVAEAGGLGALPTALLNAEQLRSETAAFRAGAKKRPLNMNFFCHTPPAFDEAREANWRAKLAPYYGELQIDPKAPIPTSNRAPFDDALCALVEELKPEVVSFHFGLPSAALFARVKTAGAKVLASASTVDEAKWLAARGCDAVIAQGAEAGGHHSNFLGSDPRIDCLREAGTIALVPQIVDAIDVPVIAAGGIADGRGIAAAFALGASAVQLGTAYLHCPEARVPPLHRAALRSAKDDSTALTNLFTGRPARGIVNRAMRELGPISPDAPAFPLAGGALAPLKAAAEAQGSSDFGSLWAGQAAALSAKHGLGAAELTKKLAADAKARLAKLAGR